VRAPKMDRRYRLPREKHVGLHALHRCHWTGRKYRNIGWLLVEHPPPTQTLHLYL